MLKKPKKTVADVPRLLKEWDAEENAKEGLFPDALGSQSSKYAHWHCEYGHKWVAKINNRYNGRGCPHCSKQMRSSFPEQAVFFYVRKAFPDAINGYRDIFPNNMELDVYVPSLKIGVEYDGVVWHRDSGLERERIKYAICRENGIKLLRIKENKAHWGVAGLADEIIHIIPDKPYYLDIAIRIVLSYMGDCDLFAAFSTNHLIDLPSFSFDPMTKKDSLVEIAESMARQQRQFQRLIDSLSGPKVRTDVNSKRDRNLIFESYKVARGEASFASKHPDVAEEWDWEKNGGLTPAMFAEQSSVKVWWKCKAHGHLWQASFGVRARGNGCPYCAGQKVLVGFNDLGTKYPEIAMQWHPTENGFKKPTDFTSGSGHEAWWLCPTCGQSWKAKINNRTVNGRGCPYCEHERPIPGVNDLPTLRPDLMEEWDYEKNEGKDPSSFMPASNQWVWWKCKKCGYEYRALINNRSKGTGCKRCAGQVLQPGINDLASLYPELAKEWDYEKNGGIGPDDVFAQTNKKYWWIDSFGHSWRTSPSCRIQGTNCPICSGNKVLKGFNDLATTHPKIAAEWHPTKNGPLKPTDISKGYTKKVWFLCPKCGGEYDSYIGNKVKGYGKCPHCSLRKTRAKKVYLIETGQCFDTLKEAARSVGRLDIRPIQSCCAGKRKQAYGYHWEYRVKE